METSFKEHFRQIWYFVRTRQVAVFWARPKGRFLGPHYTWYDGPHYGFGFWLFTVSAWGHKDYDRGQSRFKLLDFLEKLKIGKMK